MSIVRANENTLKEWTDLAVLLFPDSTFEEELCFHESILKSENEIGLLYQTDGQYVGFMHLAIRNDYVNGTDASPVLYVEALYVLPEYRTQGIGKEFIKYAEEYAKQRGIKQLASDCFIDNALSENFHKSCGFVEKERVICFVKDVEQAQL